MLTIKDLNASKDLDVEAMKNLRGGGWLYGSGDSSTMDKVYYAAYRLFWY